MMWVLSKCKCLLLVVILLPALASTTKTTSVSASAVISTGAETVRNRLNQRHIHTGICDARHQRCDVVQLGPALSIRGGDKQKQQKELAANRKDEKKTPPWVEGLKNSLASALAAGCSKTILAPFDTIKTIQQQYSSSSAGGLSLLEAARMVMNRPNGFRELYAGLGVSVVGAMPSVGLYFGVYSYCKRKIGPALQSSFGGDGGDNKSLSKAAARNIDDENTSRLIRTITIATSAAIGNTIASFSRVPYEVIKQNLQTGEYTTTMNAIRSMAQSGGIRAFFPLGGVSIQMIRDIPYAIFTLLAYEYLRDNVVLPYKQNRQLDASPWWLDMIVGGTAGGIGSYLTNPFDVIKTRIQTNPTLYNGNIGKCFQVAYDEGGPMVFLRGSVPRLLHKVPANAFFFLFYEFFKVVLNVHPSSDGR